MIQRIMLLATVSLLAACGPGRIEKPNTNLSTLIEIVYLDTGNNTINFRLSHRQADTRAPSTLECRLRINDGVYQALPSLQIPELTAYARERFSWGLPKDHSIPKCSEQHVRYFYRKMIGRCIHHYTTSRKKFPINK